MNKKLLFVGMLILVTKIVYGQDATDKNEKAKLWVTHTKKDVSKSEWSKPYQKEITQFVNDVMNAPGVHNEITAIQDYKLTSELDEKHRQEVQVLAAMECLESLDIREYTEVGYLLFKKKLSYPDALERLDYDMMRAE